ncbi:MULTISPECIES: 2-oxoglutarate dehydrogenase complex dihydrolipoyllysine-residue succinyltransferase [Methylocaldum]|jgi:2-oxoglutarate dehydrogenase E2 component (dihydrolipoamide succinyltransferase)|uniref:2-oxoglutarate dehydrogenase complex dihydrolipoyllysine-residue succinyltransferase n=1 Tax=unclassified Methylocaldum TaxID=2622260 RepID=UPI00098B925B|nr:MULTISPECIES: 2-oxoglutarate dehydrogenase complex dihydrolipoyllysine-residue succinyltransferase [unclassified Methylocaldum]MBP1151490.1 2-oxoglutarate dehydrogenase E2 component (dihydrolipoamide succinyltransferase) [Methylocaldum sp. RMAD-M]MDV3242647.1 2-oxoglutarate dehydrogenase complex dihydrolipoyllysine-residue succinyltransferase [Methylocaldum sp.]MVF22651.1 2-oxoglutarate dehydrogenase complex dihydrolipoyllysine-residue succinyltransferase [Methylocaldum sp. BRCS4]
MRIEVTVPNLPESITDATLLDWRKQPGDTVQKSETLVDLETDKVILEVPVPDNGVLQEIRHAKGDVVGSGELLAVIETEARPAVAETAAPPEIPAKPEPAAVPEAVPRPVRFAQPMGPSVRRLIMEHNLDPAQIKGTGREGRLTKQDVLDYLESQKRKTVEAVAPARRPEPAPKERPEVRATEGRGERRVPMTRLRARIAERMIEAQHTTATLTTFNEVNLQKIFDLRNQHRARFEQEYKIKLGFMSFFVKAAVEGLRRFPIINASIDGNDIVYHDYYDIGIAVSTDRGLVVPILRDADRLNFAEIEKAIIDFSQKARDGKLSFEELSGGTFTITNGGIFGSMLSTPILNPPQSAILGMHVIKDRPVVEDGQIVIRPMIYLALSYDHRIIDGREAVTFLFTLKELLEDPVRLLLKI